MKCIVRSQTSAQALGKQTQGRLVKLSQYGAMCVSLVKEFGKLRRLRAAVRAAELRRMRAAVRAAELRRMRVVVRAADLRRMSAVVRAERAEAESPPAKVATKLHKKRDSARLKGFTDRQLGADRSADRTP